MESLGRSRSLNQGKGEMRGEIAPCYVKKLAGKERYYNDQTFFKVVQWRRRRIEAGISDIEVEEKNQEESSECSEEISRFIT